MISSFNFKRGVDLHFYRDISSGHCGHDILLNGSILHANGKNCYMKVISKSMKVEVCDINELASLADDDR